MKKQRFGVDCFGWRFGRNGNNGFFNSLMKTPIFHWKKKFWFNYAALNFRSALSFCSCAKSLTLNWNYFPFADLSQNSEIQIVIKSLESVKKKLLKLRYQNCNLQRKISDLKEIFLIATLQLNYRGEIRLKPLHIYSEQICTDFLPRSPMLAKGFKSLGAMKHDNTRQLHKAF